MCGITGYWSPGREASAPLAAAMAHLIQHRGPDDAGTWLDRDAGLGLAHRRLSILDFSPAGHQPMAAPRGPYFLCFNDETYNHRALRYELEAVAGRSSGGGTRTRKRCWPNCAIGVCPGLIRLRARFSGRPAAIVYNSTASAWQHAVLGFSTRKSCVIPNGFDTTEFRPDASRRARILSEFEVPSGAVVIGIMARLHPMKEHDGFLLAAARFKQEWPNAVFVLAGEGTVPENARIAERVRNLGLEEHVRLCGRTEDVAALDAALDMGTLSFAWGEMFPNSIGEAMACGVPCVATDVGDTREIIGDTGEVVAPGDPEALCAAWLRLARLADADRRALDRRARRRIVERYGLPAVTAHYAELYRELGGKRSCAA